MKRSFTLTELVVIIAVFAVSAALLLPAVQKAAAKGEAAGCADNLRRLAAAARTYIESNQGVWPCRHEFRSSYITALAADGLVPKEATNNSAQTFASCPSIPVVKTPLGPNSWPQVYGTQYAHNNGAAALKGAGMLVADRIPDNVAFSAPGKRIPDAGAVPLSRRVMLFDCAATTSGKEGASLQQSARGFVVGSTTNTIYGAPHFRHDGRMSFAAFAGNVESETLAEHKDTGFYPYFGHRLQSVLMQRWFDADDVLAIREAAAK